MIICEIKKKEPTERVDATTDTKEMHQESSHTHKDWKRDRGCKSDLCPDVFVIESGQKSKMRSVVWIEWKQIGEKKHDYNIPRNVIINIQVMLISNQLYP